MKVLCTRPYCTNPLNNFPELDNPNHLKTAQQKYCTTCGMYLILGGRYLPTKLLGKGGFGAAFLAIDRYSPTLRKCVVKQFQPEGNLGQRELELAQKLFEREALVLEKLGHRHEQIPNLFAFFPLLIPSRSNPNQQEQYFYLVQEFIDGQDLETELRQQGPFSENKVTEVLTEVLSILQFVHDNDSIHRDIKPSNIMRNSQGLLYLLDFGAVKQVTAGVGNNPQAKSTGIYSMGFAPPEQMTGGQVYPSTDLYALAVTCLNLLTGKDSSELYNSYNNQWQWRKYAPNVSDRLGQILDKMLLPSPSERFQSAEEVLAALSTPPPSPSIPQSSTTIQTPPNPLPSPPLPPQPVVQKQSPPPQPKIRRPSKPLPLFAVLSGAAFTGFEAVLLGIALQSALPSLAFNFTIGIWGGIVGLIILAVLTRTIEKIDLIIIGIISLGLVWYFPFLHKFILEISQLGKIGVIILPIVAAILLMMIASLFLLVYKFISRIF